MLIPAVSAPHSWTAAWTSTCRMVSGLVTKAYVSPLHTLHLQSRVTVMQSERGERGIRFDVEDL